MGKLSDQAHDGCQRRPAKSMAFQTISPCRAQLAPSRALQICLPPGPERSIPSSTLPHKEQYFCTSLIRHFKNCVYAPKKVCVTLHT